jgi:hypothetical protein
VRKERRAAVVCQVTSVNHQAAERRWSRLRKPQITHIVPRKQQCSQLCLQRRILLEPSRNLVVPKQIIQNAHAIQILPFFPPLQITVHERVDLVDVFLMLLCDLSKELPDPFVGERLEEGEDVGEAEDAVPGFQVLLAFFGGLRVHAFSKDKAANHVECEVGVLNPNSQTVFKKVSSSKPTKCCKSIFPSPLIRSFSICSIRIENCSLNIGTYVLIVVDENVLFPRASRASLHFGPFF